LPIRIISEALGATPIWDNATRTAYIYKDDVVLRLPMGVPLPDGMGVPEMRNNRVLVPARFVIENFDAITLWDAALRQVTVYVV
ncbi:MAG: copper amine oxidase N-terminal domain-containing protein, partial [Defluviitaleaceae bacterium]|nr:copper amine oxidase N-terminal domain-containing protein [Defluviitaleaceae bacterium]